MTPNRPPSSNPILVWGAGAMGGTIGAALLRAGHAVRFVDRDQEHISAMSTHGLRIVGPVAEFVVSVDAVRPADLTGTYTQVFLCVKAHHTEEAVAELEPFLEDTGFVVSIQNGLNEQVISAKVGAARAVGAFVNFGADVLEPGVIHWGGRGAVVVGELGGQRTGRLDELHTLLLDFDRGAIQTGNIQGYLWGKLAYGALLFATALTDNAIADVLAEERYRTLLTEIGREVCAVAERLGIRTEGFDGFDPAAFAPGAADGMAHRSLLDLVAFNRRSAKTHSGIWRDLAVRRRKTEVGAQLGPIVEAGKAVDVGTPLIQAIAAQVGEIEAGVRSQGWHNLDELEEGLVGGH